MPDLDTFLPIPDFPRYEINSAGVVRNKRTGKILKPKIYELRGRQFWAYCLYNKGKFCRGVKNLWTQATAAAEDNTFKPIPSFNGKYEINEQGVVRNARTKQTLKSRDDKNISYSLYNGKRRTSRCYRVVDLLWETHGIIDKTRIPTNYCYAQNQDKKYLFKSRRQCAMFLTDKVHYHVNTICKFLSKRKTEIGDWIITYLTPQTIGSE